MNLTLWIIGVVGGVLIGLGIGGNMTMSAYEEKAIQAKVGQYNSVTGLFEFKSLEVNNDN
jgi:hypothetical protein